jgi:hypothetical protein
MDFGRRQVNLVQLFRVDERHFGQGKGIETIGLYRSSQVSPQSGHFLRLGFHQPAVRMTGSQIDSHHQPWQACGFEDYDRIGAVPENALFQSRQPLRCGLEAEAITGLRSIIQAARPVSPLV